ncbi:MAG: biotin/lipoyl-containing protein [Spirochaetota bacterium]
MATEVFLPKMTDHMDSGEIVKWLVREGDWVEKGQTILEVMTDKAVVEVEAPASGVVKGIRSGVDDGTSVPVGEMIAFIAAPEEEVPLLPPVELKGSSEREDGRASIRQRHPTSTSEHEDETDETRR